MSSAKAFGFVKHYLHPWQPLRDGSVVFHRNPVAPCLFSGARRRAAGPRRCTSRPTPSRRLQATRRRTSPKCHATPLLVVVLSRRRRRRCVASSPSSSFSLRSRRARRGPAPPPGRGGGVGSRSVSGECPLLYDASASTNASSSSRRAASRCGASASSKAFRILSQDADASRERST